MNTVSCKQGTASLKICRTTCVLTISISAKIFEGFALLGDKDGIGYLSVKRSAQPLVSSPD